MEMMGGADLRTSPSAQDRSGSVEVAINEIDETDVLIASQKANEPGIPPCPSDTGPNAVQAVIENEDVLAIILQCFKEEPIGVREDGRPAETWKGALAQLLRVSSVFHRVGASLVWNKVDSLDVVLALLPWYRRDQGKYSGIGTHSYKSKIDWQRLEFYASRIHHMHIAALSNVNVEPHWIPEIMTLQGRPDQFFPALQTITIGLEAYPRIACIFLLVNPGLQSVSIEICHMDPESSPVVPQQPEQANLLAVLPVFSFRTPMLRQLSYQGPIDENIAHGLSNLRTLRSLHLHIACSTPSGCLKKVLRLPLLESLQVSAPSLVDTVAAVEKKKRKKGKKKSELSPQAMSDAVSRLFKLQIATSDLSHYLVGSLFRSVTNLNRLELIILDRNQNHLYRTLALYLESCQRVLQSLRIQFTWNDQSSMSQAQSETYFADTAWTRDRVSVTLRNATKLEQVTFEALPPAIAPSIINILRSTVHRWVNLTDLILRVHDDEANANITIKHSPPLSFLRTNIWKYCPKLKSLEFPFSEESITNEDISSALDTIDDDMDAMGVLGDYHPLKSITFGIGGGFNEMTTVRGIQIATFLDGLFPQLKSVRGASDAWERVERLVMMHQDQRMRVLRRVERMASAALCRGVAPSVIWMIDSIRSERRICLGTTNQNVLYHNA